MDRTQCTRAPAHQENAGAITIVDQIRIRADRVFTQVVGIELFEGNAQSRGNGIDFVRVHWRLPSCATGAALKTAYGPGVEIPGNWIVFNMMMVAVIYGDSHLSI